MTTTTTTNPRRQHEMKYPNTIHVRLTEMQRQKLDRLATAEGNDRSAIVRRMISVAPEPEAPRHIVKGY